MVFTKINLFNLLRLTNLRMLKDSCGNVNEQDKKILVGVHSKTLSDHI